MNRFTGIIILSILILTAGCISKKEKQPNLLFVFSDQQTYDMLGCYGNEQIISPNIDKFAEEGLKFNHCFTNSPTCTPYRGMLMSGKHAVQYLPIWSFYDESYKGVITRDWTFSTTRFSLPAGMDPEGSPLHCVLFDRKNDPYQLNNLINDEELKSVRDSLWQLTTEWMGEYQDDYYTNEDLYGVMNKEEWDRNYVKLPIDILKSSVSK